MSISTPPPPQKKKSACGCLGCGCGIVGLLILLIIGLLGGIGYYSYRTLTNLTATAPSDVPTFTDTAASYTTVQQKLSDMQTAVQNHKSGSIHLTADDINTLIDHSPDMAKNNIRTFVTLTDNEGRLQASVPTEAITQGLMKNAYLNFDITFGLTFDPVTKSIAMVPHTLSVGDKDFIGGNASRAPSAGFSKSFLDASNPFFAQSFNQGLRKNPQVAALLDQAKTIEIKDGELVIETQ